MFYHVKQMCQGFETDCFTKSQKYVSWGETYMFHGVKHIKSGYFIDFKGKMTTF